MKITPAHTEKFPLPRSWRRVLVTLLGGACLALGANGALAQISITTLAGTAGSAGAGDATGVDARFKNPAGLAVDASSGPAAGTIYVADTGNHTIRKITAAGAVTTLAGLAGTSGSADGTGTAARFKSPEGLAIDSTGANLYVADTGNSTIRKVEIATGVVTTLAGTVGTFSSADATGAAAQLNGPTGIVVGVGDTNLYVADLGNHTIRRVTLPSAAVVTIAGSAGNPGALNGTGSAARFFLPRGIAADANNLYVADSGNHTIRAIAISSGAVSTLAGSLNASVSGSTDATGAAATFRNPGAVAVRGSNLYVADTGNSTVRQIIIGSGATTTLAGTALQTGSTDAIGAAARFAASSPSGIAVDAAGNLYLADNGNHTVRKGGPVTAPAIGAQPGDQSVGIGATATFTVSATGNPTPLFQWQRQAGGAGAFIDLADAGAYSGTTTSTLTVAAVTSGMNGDKFRCVITNSAPGTVTSNVVTLVVTQVPVFTSAAGAQFSVGIAGSFTVAATGSPAPTFAITAGADPSSVGVTLSPAGVLSGTPTSATGSPFSFTITATSAGAGSVAQNFILTVQTGASITTSPANQLVAAGTTATFTVVAGGINGTLAYQWYRAPAADPTNFQSLGTGDTTYTGTQAATLSVVNPTATMNGDLFRCAVSSGFGLPATSAAATLTISQLPAFTSAASTTFAAGIASTYQVRATGSPTPTFSITAGTSPSTIGVTLSDAGLLSGTASGTVGSPFTFTITATNAIGTVTQSFTLTVIPSGALPSFTTQPTNQSANTSGTVSFTVVATGLPAPTLQWQRQAANTTGFVNLTDGGAYSGTTTATLTVSNVSTGMNGDQFQCVATNTGGSATSTAASLSVTPPITIGTFAGLAGSTGSIDATGSAARFNLPAAIAIDHAGNAFVADTINCTVRKITPAGVVTSIAGLAGAPGNVDGNGATARFNGPSGIGVDSLGNVFVADTFNQTIRVITPTGTVSTLAGLAGSLGSTDGAGADARFSYPTGLAVAPSGTIFVADSFNHTIRAITPAGVVSTYAGAAGVRGSVDGFGSFGSFVGDARFANPGAVAVDTVGNVYVADTFNHTIRKIETTSRVTTIAGQAAAPGSVDGTGNAARFNQPGGLAVDAAGNVYVADTLNNTLRKITPAGVVTTLAGLAGSVGSADDAGSVARFNQPSGIAVDTGGVILIVDTRNDTIRRSGIATAPTITTQPVSKIALPTQNATFAVVATGIPALNYQWQRQAVAATSFTNLTNDATYAGVTTATLTIAGVTAAMDGDQFRCVIGNLISPDAVTNVVTLSTAVVVPVFTSATSTNFTAGQAGNFTVTATGTPVPTFTASGLPSWASLNATTGVITGTPPDATGSPFAITLTASNGLTATQNFTLTTLITGTSPTIVTPPVSTSVDRGVAATFTVAVNGTTPLTYQWSKDGAAIDGATNAILTVTNVQPASTGAYVVKVSNLAGSVSSAPATLSLNSVPAITAQPRAQVALAGGTAAFSVVATGGLNLSYQWRFNAQPIAAATSATLTLTNVQAANAGDYDVQITNSLGSVTSATAQLAVSTAPVLPLITSSPASRTLVAGASASLSVVASSVPEPTFQWRKDGAAIPDATSASLTLASVQKSDTANYDVVVTNSAGSVASPAAVVKVIVRSYAGTYIGTTGNFALFVRADNTAVLLGVVPGANGGSVSNLSFAIGDTGSFSYAVGGAIVSGAIANDGTASINVTGSISAVLVGPKAPDVGTAQALSGYYEAGVAGAFGAAYAIVAANGQVYALTQGRDGVDGGLAPLDTSNRAAIATQTGTITVTLAAGGSPITINGVRNNQTTIFAGASESALATQRLANISTRARVDTGSNVAIAGFVITGQDSKLVLIRAIGPTLAGFGVPTALGAPKLDLYRGVALIASNAGWSSSANTAAIVAATVQAGGFPLAVGTADSVILTTLQPGAYTAQVSAVTGAAGVALVEVYDLSPAAAGQKLFNISTRANAGSGDATLIAGISVNGTVPKRVLVRAVGPGLAQFGLTGVLAAPQLQLIKDGQVIASNTGLNTSPDAVAIAAASAQVGAFPLPAGSSDCALLVNLAPGNYSAVVTGLGGATGIAIVEVYEVP